MDENIRPPDDNKVDQLIGQSPNLMDDPEFRRDVEYSMTFQSQSRPRNDDAQLELALAESLRASCPNCSRGTMAQLYIMCAECGTMMIKSASTWASAKTARLCTNCGYRNEVDFGNCTRQQCERLVELNGK